MDSQPDDASYRKCMEEIKRRLRAIDDILNGSRTTSFKYTNVEFVCLQFRKIFELIILSTFASHKHLFEGLTRKLSKEWQIGKIIAIVEKKNPAFYPEPIDRVPSDRPEIKDDWKTVTSGVLKVEELVAAHGLIGNLMHANNPYNEELLLEEIERQFPEWRAKLIRLLDNHLVTFPDDKSILYVGMQDENGNVHSNLFLKADIKLPEIAAASERVR
jgi:hypothetical protein